MPYITNNNIKINFELLGNDKAEPLIMLHPNGHCIKDWHILGYTTQLQKYFRLILIDGRGFGSSDKPHDASYYQQELIASDTVAVMNHLNIDRANCFGYSMGGRNAFALMNYHPERFNSFIIAGAHPYAINKLLNSYISLLRQGLPKLVEVFEKNYGIFPSEIKNNFLKNDLDALLIINSLPLVDYSEALVNYHKKVCFIIGDKDPLLDNVVKANQISKFSQINIIPNQNHMQLFFSSKIITPIIRDFIKKIEV